MTTTDKLIEREKNIDGYCKCELFDSVKCPHFRFDRWVYLQNISEAIDLSQCRTALMEWKEGGK